MDDNQLADLKQFIATTMAQTENRLTDRLDRLEQRVGNLERKIDDGFAGVGDAIENVNRHVGERLSNLERRIT